MTGEIGKIEGVKIDPLKLHHDDRGFLTEVQRADAPDFTEFGQFTFTLAHPGVIKAFHWHQHQVDTWFFVTGSAQVVLFDRRPGSPTAGTTQVICAGEHNRVRITIPVGVAHGYRVLGNKPATLCYLTSRPYNASDPDEQRIPYDDPSINFNWITAPR